MIALVILLLMGGQGAFAETSLKFDGIFMHPSVSGTGCSEVFLTLKYRASHYRVGPTKRTSVLHFSSEMPGAFFDGVSLIGLYGYSADILVERTFEREGVQYQIIAEGIVDYRFLLLDLKLIARKEGVVLCRAKADFESFY